MTEKLFGYGLVPVVRLERAEDALPLGKALTAGGLPLAEVSVHSAAASDAIRALRGEMPDMTIGAGSITSLALAEEAAAAGAQFIATPGFNADVAAWCLKRGMPVYPGCSTATEVEQAQNLGLDVVKFFPAEQSGGLGKIKALSAPYPAMRFMPEGGIHTGNLAQYLASDQVLACGCAFMAGEELIRAGDWEGVTRLAREGVDTVLGLELAHVGMYPGSAGAADELARELSALIGLASRDVGLSLFVGPGVEIMKQASDWKGHIAYGVHSVERAEFHFRQRGKEFVEATRVRNPEGKTLRIYFKEVTGGFAVHLMRK